MDSVVGLDKLDNERKFDLTTKLQKSPVVKHSFPRSFVVGQTMASFIAIQSEFHSLNFLGSTIEKSFFIDTKFVESDFNEAIFRYVQLSRVALENCSIRNMTFTQCSIDNTRFDLLRSLETEDAVVFDNCVFQQTNLHPLKNASFKDCVYLDCELPHSLALALKDDPYVLNTLEPEAPSPSSSSPPPSTPSVAESPTTEKAPEKPANADSRFDKIEPI